MISTPFCDVDVMSVLEWIVLSRILSIIAALSLSPPHPPPHNDSSSSSTTTTTTKSSSSSFPADFLWVRYILDVIHLTLCLVLCVKVLWMFVNKYFWWSFLFNNPCCKINNNCNDNQQQQSSGCLSASSLSSMVCQRKHCNEFRNDDDDNSNNPICLFISKLLSSGCRNFHSLRRRTVSKICKDIQRLSMWNSRERWYDNESTHAYEETENEMVPLLLVVDPPPPPRFIMDRGGGDSDDGGRTSSTTESLLGTKAEAGIREKDL